MSVSNSSGPLSPPSEFGRWLLRRRVQSTIWRHLTVHRLRRENVSDFCRRSGLPADESEAARTMQERLRHRFFFHPRNRKDFFLNVLTSLQSYDDIVDEGEETLENKFATLGSGLQELGPKIDWQKDFKSGMAWPLAPSHTLDLLQLGSPSDVKVPWELSRFHQVWWLGKAHWVTGHDSYAAKFMSLVEDWIEANPVGYGVNWSAAMEASIRACNWVAGYYFFCETRSIPPSFWLRFFRSLYQHGLFIEHNLEYALPPGNHYIANLAGLVTLGVIFRETAWGRRWIHQGVNGLEEEMERQVLPDGVSWEKSTSYHRLVLELFLVPTLLARLNGHRFSPAYDKRLHDMFRFVAAYQRRDGTIPLIGDSDDGRLFRLRRKDDVNDHRHILSVGAVLYEDPVLRDAAGGFREDALWLKGGEGFEKFRLVRGEVPAPTSIAFPDSGFYVLRGPDVHVMVDAGDHGMGGHGRHGHNDTLSFEYWTNEGPLIVDPGTYAYSSDIGMRQHFRSTRSHNTVMVDNREQTEFSGVWSIEQDLTRPELLSWYSEGEVTELQASHRGYERLHLPVRHQRSWTLFHDTGRLVVEDLLTGAGEHECIASFHVAPQVRAVYVGGRSVVLASADTRFQVTLSAGEISVESAMYSPTYGVQQTTSVIRVQLEGPLPLRLTSVIERSAVDQTAGQTTVKS